jgi:hypothetical protein
MEELSKSKSYRTGMIMGFEIYCLNHYPTLVFNQKFGRTHQEKCPPCGAKKFEK